ncbi:MAG: hypothetical protein P8O69_07240, partial [Amylibacter sp.]|nr:hypothetical protein [Amylibacter sp.]
APHIFKQFYAVICPSHRRLLKAGAGLNPRKVFVSSWLILRLVARLQDESIQLASNVPHCVI